MTLDGIRKTIALAEHDRDFITNASIVESTDTGSMTQPSVQKTGEDSGAWALWERLASKDPSFGNPAVFSSQVDLQKWVSFTVTMHDPTFLRHLSSAYPYIPGVSGLMTIVDSNWLLSIVVAAQPHFASQPAGVEVFSDYGLDLTDKMKPAIEASKVNCRPTMMPFIDSAFMPRSPGDRPDVVPAGRPIRLPGSIRRSARRLCLHG